MAIIIVKKPSANFSEQAIQHKYLIIHCIGFNEEKALNLLTKTTTEGGGGVSAHYFIPQRKQQSFISQENGYPVYQLVEEDKLSFHAGKSKWHENESLNKCALGIEFHSPNYANALQEGGNLDWFHFEEFEDKQIVAGIELLTTLINKYQIDPRNILGHSDVSPYRENEAHEIILGKTDPGATFPWERFAKAGIGVWPKSERTRTGLLQTTLENTQQLLKEYGYNIQKTGVMDLETQHVIKAFQMHFMPKECTGNISDEMTTLLENLIDNQLKYAPIMPKTKIEEKAEITFSSI